MLRYLCTFFNFILMMVNQLLGKPCASSSLTSIMVVMLLMNVIVDYCRLTLMHIFVKKLLLYHCFRMLMKLCFEYLSSLKCIEKFILHSVLYGPYIFILPWTMVLLCRIWPKIVVLLSYLTQNCCFYYVLSSIKLFFIVSSDIDFLFLLCLIWHRIVIFVVSCCFDSISPDLNRTGVLFRLSSLPSYFVPKDSFSVSSYLTYIELLPTIDHPEAFGQHPNADIASQIQQTKNFFDALQSIQPNLLTTESTESDEMVRLGTCSHSYQYSFFHY